MVKPSGRFSRVLHRLVPPEVVIWYTLAVVVPALVICIVGSALYVNIGTAIGFWFLGNIPGLIFLIHVLVRKGRPFTSPYSRSIDIEACPHGDISRPHTHGYEWVRTPVCYVKYHRTPGSVTEGTIHLPTTRYSELEGGETVFSYGQEQSRHSYNTPQRGEGGRPVGSVSPESLDKAPVETGAAGDLVGGTEDVDLHDAAELPTHAPAYEAVASSALSREEMSKVKDDTKEDRKSF